MKPNDLPPATGWTLARRAERMNPSVIREILKVTERPGIISFAGGLPSPQHLPGRRVRRRLRARCCATTARPRCSTPPAKATRPLREAVAAMLPWKVDPGAGADHHRLAAGPGPGGQGADRHRQPRPGGNADLPRRAAGLRADGARGRRRAPATTKASTSPTSPAKRRRRALPLRAAQLPEPDRPHHERGAPRGAGRRPPRELGLPLVEDNPYGDLWFDPPPPLPLTARNPDGCIYLGSFSKVLAPGLRLGFLVAPPAIYPKLLQAKQAADLHSPSFNQRMVAEVMKDGFLRPPRADHPRAVQVAARRDAGRARARDGGPGRAAGTRPTAACSCGRACPQGMDAVDAAAARRWTRAWPSCRAPPSTPSDADARTLRLSFVTATRGADRHRHRGAGRDASAQRWEADAMLKIWGRISSINVRKVVFTAQVLEPAVRAHRCRRRVRHRHARRSTWRATRTRWCRCWRTTASTLWESNVIVRYLCAQHSARQPLPARPARSASTPSAGWTGSRPRSTRAGRDAFVQLVRTPAGPAQPRPRSPRRSQPRAAAGDARRAPGARSPSWPATPHHGRHPDRLRDAPLAGPAAGAPARARTCSAGTTACSPCPPRAASSTFP